MRMQLIKYNIIIAILLFYYCNTNAQDGERNMFQKMGDKARDRVNRDTGKVDEIRKLDPVEIDFLMSYYQQDGDKSPVTGGIGTEKLSDITPKIIVSAPLNPKMKLSVDAGLDYYTSASTDNIDNNVSSASLHDVRTHANVGVTRTNEDKSTSYGLKAGVSSEYDYFSTIIGASFTKTSKNGNCSLGLSAQAFFDRWYIIYPVELRDQGPLVPTDKRRSYNFSMTYSQVLNKRMQASISLEGVYMNGLLSTPFHRVYFQEQNQAKVEQLPDTRLKVPVGLRFNYYMNDYIMARTYYRYYWDSWGVKAHTASLELPVKINRFFSVYPFYRYHTQTAADYYKPYKEHSVNDKFYTSDTDLAALNSHTFGLGFRYSPANGISRMKIPFVRNRLLVLKGIDVRYGHYRRSTGLNGHIISAGLNFEF